MSGKYLPLAEMFDDGLDFAHMVFNGDDLTVDLKAFSGDDNEQSGTERSK